MKSRMDYLPAAVHKWIEGSIVSDLSVRSYSITDVPAGPSFPAAHRDLLADLLDSSDSEFKL